MKLLLHNRLDPGVSDAVHHHVCRGLEQLGHEVRYASDVDMSALPLEDYDLFVSNAVVRPACRSRVRAYGGIWLARPLSLAMLERGGIPVVPWALAESTAAVDELFERWAAQRLLLKRSGTYGGTGVTAFTRDGLAGLNWDPGADIFCPEVNASCGDVYKAEVFGGDILIEWKSSSPPLKDLLKGPALTGIAGSYGDRTLCQFPPALRTAVEVFARELHEQGLGHCSLDFMRDANGQFHAIEINFSRVALWWTQPFGFFRERMTAALARMLAA